MGVGGEGRVPALSSAIYNFLSKICRMVNNCVGTTSSKQNGSSSSKCCASHVKIYYCDLQCILFIVLSDQTGNIITVKVEAVTSAQDKGLVQTNRRRNPLSG